MTGRPGSTPLRAMLKTVEARPGATTDTITRAANLGPWLLDDLAHLGYAHTRGGRWWAGPEPPQQTLPVD